MTPAAMQPTQAAAIVAAHYGNYDSVHAFAGEFMRYERMSGKAMGLYTPDSATYVYPDGSAVLIDYEAGTLALQPAGQHGFDPDFVSFGL